MADFQLKISKTIDNLKKKLDDPQEILQVFDFDVIDAHTLNCQATITDNWLENNSAVQDAIAINPLTVTLSGLVGEVVYEPPHKWSDWITNKLDGAKLGNITILSNKLTVLGGLVPTVDNYTQLAMNAVSYAENAYNHYKNVAKTILGTKKPKYRQYDIVQALQEFWQTRQVCTVSTPWGDYENMYIQNIQASQTGTTTQSQISVTLKQLKFVEVQSTKADKAVLDKYASYNRALETNNGKAPGVFKSIAKGGTGVAGKILGF